MCVVIKLKGMYIGKVIMTVNEIRDAEKEGFTVIKAN